MAERKLIGGLVLKNLQILICLCLLVCCGNVLFSQVSTPIEINEVFIFELMEGGSEEQYILDAKTSAIESVFGFKANISNTSQYEYSMSIKNSNTDFSEDNALQKNTVTKGLGLWLQDLSSPELDYYKEKGRKFVAVKVHGYVLKPPNKSEAREQLSAVIMEKPLHEGVQLYAIPYYDNDFIVSIAILDKRIHDNPAQIDTEARIIAESNLIDAPIIDKYRKAHGWVPSMEFLNSIKGPTDNHMVFIFIKEVEKD